MYRRVRYTLLGVLQREMIDAIHIYIYFLVYLKLPVLLPEDRMKKTKGINYIKEVKIFNNQ